ncbi:hypothetical protein GEMRC1_010532 [Eukaryota sp. GEM-RC1]
MDRGAVDLLFETVTSCIFLFCVEKVRPTILHPPFGTTRLGGVSLEELFDLSCPHRGFFSFRVCDITECSLQDGLDEWFVNCNTIVSFPLKWNQTHAKKLKNLNEDSVIIQKFKNVLEKAWCLRHLLMMPSCWPDVDMIIPMKNNNGKIGMLKCQVKSHGTSGMMSSCVQFQVAGIPSISLGCGRKPVPSSWVKSTSLRELWELQKVKMDYHTVFMLNSFHFTRLHSSLEQVYTHHDVYADIDFFNCLD